jgi:hypothetical protein
VQCSKDSLAEVRQIATTGAKPGTEEITTQQRHKNKKWFFDYFSGLTGMRMAGLVGGFRRYISPIAWFG